jgi:hypothetical protein
MHVGARKGTGIQIQLTRKVTPKRPIRLAIRGRCSLSQNNKSQTPPQLSHYAIANGIEARYFQLNQGVAFPQWVASNFSLQRVQKG